MHLDIIGLILIEISIVIGLSRLMGIVFRRFGQPLVIGEIVAGILLGPSFFGSIFPQLSSQLFPSTALPYLNVLSQIGLIFFMFLIGLELEPKYLRGQLKVALITSNVSIILPFSLGAILAWFLFPSIATNNVSFTTFALFIGAAMSITAFPVLARIITENNLQGTKLGTLALTCAAVDDITAWCLLAVAIASVRTNNLINALPTVLAAFIYAVLMLSIVRRWLKPLSLHYKRAQKISQGTLAVVYIGVLVSALITEIIGIHFIFGAFLLGVVMPKNGDLTRELAIRTEDFVLTFLLPIFFAFSGLRTQIGLLNTPQLWLICGAILIVAIVGKYCGAYFAARFCGIEKREAAALGWLMNTRGLTELIILNIGLSLGVISPTLFTMLVIMALVTTFMTSPLLQLTKPKKATQLDATVKSEILADYKILVPVANPNTQQGLLAIAIAVAFTEDASQSTAAIYPLNLIEPREDYTYEEMPYEIDRQLQKRKRNLEEAISAMQPAQIAKLIYPRVGVTNQVGREVTQLVKEEKIDLVIVGWHRSSFSHNRLGGRVGQILNSVPVDVVVWVEKPQLQTWNRLLVPYSGTIHDDLGLELALRLLFNDRHRRLTLLRIADSKQETAEFSYETRSILDRLPQEIYQRIDFVGIVAENSLQSAIEASANADLTIVGTSREWGLERQTLGIYTDALVEQCHSPLLIARKYNQITSHINWLDLQKSHF
jgi:Kef-type K+ transport system membrane component KefB/nucleotide-binding universal stress UspA family protein